MSDARKNSVSQLAELYTVVIGVALSLSIINTVDSSSAGLPLRLDRLTNLATILVLIIPFYHGAVRHLFATYVEPGGATGIKRGALLADFVLLFIEGCLFVMIANLIGATPKMAWAMVTLLLLDSVWGFLAWLAFSGPQAQFAEQRWALINVCAAVPLIVLLILKRSVPLTDDIGFQFILLSILSLRTIVDYVTCWTHYFPDE